MCRTLRIWDYTSSGCSYPNRSTNRHREPPSRVQHVSLMKGVRIEDPGMDANGPCKNEAPPSALPDPRIIHSSITTATF
ncbi:hypothetical protein BDM02DRAFT_2349593 [Thelephora ganbajun]|uniref:Uncharacterized protein n=1 Tax=Thelephora ganbajun TaxID=370292 RepID=A0ACB6ZF83_THEGA|nr:hypothetical protein BDM02DRAFT_2349593 [Thelephora ganbajun]